MSWEQHRYAVERARDHRRKIADGINDHCLECQCLVENFYEGRCECVEGKPIFAGATLQGEANSSDAEMLDDVADFLKSLDHEAERHGFVVVIGPANNPNYFTGAGYSTFIAAAKVFRTANGAMCASRIWQTADYGHPLPSSWFEARRAVRVGLQLLRP